MSRPSERGGAEPLRVTFVCQWYAPEPGHQPMWIVHALRARGAAVRVLTGLPNYPTGVLHAGYTAWRRHRERIDGVEVWRTPLYPSHDRSALRRIVNYLSWAVSAATYARPVLADADVALVYSSPATAALPALVARRRWGTPYVLLVQDVWPDSVTASGFLAGRAARPLVRLLDRLVSTTYAGASAVAVTSPGMIDLLASRGVARERLHLVHNWVADPGPTGPGRADGMPAGVGPDDFVLLYAGNHGAAQHLGPVVDAVTSLDAAVGTAPGAPTVHLVMVGDGVEKADLARRAAGCARVHLLEPRSGADVAAMAARADAQLVSWADEPLFTVTTPSKLQAVMAAGRPVLAFAGGDVARIVTGAGAGVVVPPGAPGQLAGAIRGLRDTPRAEREAMGRRGRAAYTERMAEDVGATALLGLLRQAAGRVTHDGRRTTHHSGRERVG